MSMSYFGTPSDPTRNGVMVLFMYNFLFLLHSIKSYYAEDAGCLLGDHELSVMYIHSIFINRSFGLTERTY